MFIKITLIFALAIAVTSATPVSVERSFAQSNPTLDCSHAYWGPVLVKVSVRKELIGSGA